MRGDGVGHADGHSRAQAAAGVGKIIAGQVARGAGAAAVVVRSAKVKQAVCGAQQH